MNDPQIKPAALILLERSGINAICFRRHLRDLTIVETRSWSDCLAEVRTRPGSAVVLAVGRSDWMDALARVNAIRREYPGILLIVALNRNEWERTESRVVNVFGECGCGMVIESPFHVGHAARLVIRHISSRPQPPVTLVERIWQRMPWQPANE